MLSDVFNNLEILNTPLILVIMLQDNNIFKKLTSGIIDSLTGFQDILAQSWWPNFPTGLTGHVGGHFSLSKQDWRQWHSCFPTGLLLFHTVCLLGEKCPHPFTSSWRSGGYAPWPAKTLGSSSREGCFAISGITRSGRSAKSGTPFTSDVELLPGKIVFRTLELTVPAPTNLANQGWGLLKLCSFVSP